MRYSNIFGKSLREAPKEAIANSHKLLVKGGFIDQLAAGIYTYLPLGWAVHNKIEKIIREEMDSVGGQEMQMPVMQPKNIWAETGRWDSIDPPLFKYKDRHEKEYALGPTHEEVVTDLARRFIKSYKDLPVKVYQIQDKFRNEQRSTGGVLRTREFFMKDFYSFHADKEDLQIFFKEMIAAYSRIFDRVGLKTIVAEASGGTIGGDVTYEFQAPAVVGEDLIYFCTKCGYALNKELLSEKSKDGKCPSCGGEFEETSAIEAGQVFSLGTKYSETMGAKFVDRDGKEKPLIMGCYGIGLGRMMGTIVETSHDDRGIIWPKNIAPAEIHLVTLGNNPDVVKTAEKIYEKLQKKGTEVLYDDRDESTGVKLADADLIGIPTRWVVSEKTLKDNSLEVKSRNNNKVNLMKLTSV